MPAIMTGKRPHESSREIIDLTDDKRIKIYHSGASGEGAAARRQDVRTASQGTGRVAAPESESESHEDWKNRWKTVYPRKVIRAVGDVRKQGESSGLQSESPSVYVAKVDVHGKYKDHYEHILGTYTTAASANEHVMICFAEKFHYHIENKWENWRKGEHTQDEYCND